MKYPRFARTQKAAFSVIPVKTGIQDALLDTGFRRYDTPAPQDEKWLQ
jgi:hypothetical protein